MVTSTATDLASNALGFFTSTVKDATRATVALGGELLSGNQKLGAYSAALTSNSNMFTKAIGTVVDGLIKFSEASLEEYQALSGIGATFEKEMSQIKAAAAEMGVSVADMTKIIQQNNEGLRTFGGTTDQAIGRFRAFSKDVLDSNLGTELRRLGYTAADINETLLVYQELALQDGNMQRMSARDQAQAARNFAVELDGLAKLTGKQREDLANEMKERRRQGDVQAFLMGQSAEVQDQFMLATQKISSTMGPQFTKLFQDLLIRGAPITEETRNAFIALGGSADEFEATVASFRQGMNTQNFDQFNQALTQSQGAFADNLKTQEARDIAMLGGLSPISEAMGQAYESSYNFANSLDAARESNESATETLTRLQTKITEEQAVQMANTNNLLDKTIQLQETLRDFTIVATNEVLPRLETMAVRGIDMFIDKLPTSEEIAAQLGGAVQNLFSAAEGMDSYRERANEVAANMQGALQGHDAMQNETAERIARENGAVIERQQEETRARIAESETRLADEQARFGTERREAEQALEDLTNERSDAIEAGQFDRAAELQSRIRETEAELDRVVRESGQRVIAAMQDLRRQQALLRTPNLPTTPMGNPDWRFAPRRAKGGRIDNDEVALVGEAGAEFVAGPGEVFSAKQSANILSTLSDQIAKLSGLGVNNNQIVAEIPTNQISNLTSALLSNNDQLLSEMSGMSTNQISDLTSALLSNNDQLLSEMSGMSTNQISDLTSALISNNDRFLSEISNLSTGQINEVSSKNTELNNFIQTALNGLTETQKTSQEQVNGLTNQITTNNNTEMFSTLNSNVEKMVNLLSVLISVESDAADIAGRTFRATRSLNGNMLKGVNV